MIFFLLQTHNMWSAYGTASGGGSAGGGGGGGGRGDSGVGVPAKMSRMQGVTSHGDAAPASNGDGQGLGSDVLANGQPFSLHPMSHPVGYHLPAGHFSHPSGPGVDIKQEYHHALAAGAAPDAHPAAAAAFTPALGKSGSSLYWRHVDCQAGLMSVDFARWSSTAKHKQMISEGNVVPVSVLLFIDVSHCP
jgi:hypothetical protein